MPTTTLRGMFIAAWAYAEKCEPTFYRGKFELGARVDPSHALEAAFIRHKGDVVGCLGWAVPLKGRDPSLPGGSTGAPFIHWPTRGWGAFGKDARS